MDDNILWDSLLERNKTPMIFLAWSVQTNACMASRSSKTGCMELRSQGATEDLETHREYLLYYALAV